MAIIEIGGTYSLSPSFAGASTAFAYPRSLSSSARALLPALDEKGVVRNSPPPGVYPSSLNLRPYGVSAGKSVWHVPQGCPVWRAKLGSACAVGVKAIVTKPARTTTIATVTNSLQFPKGRIKRPPSPRIARYPVVRDTPCQRTNTDRSRKQR